MKIKSIRRTPYKGKVYNLETKTHHNYVMAGVVSHNCYQDSTKEGLHAPLHTLQAVARAFGRMEVFEVAIGGGEPTSHPDFIQILEAFRLAGVVPNFTSRSLAWLKDPEKAKKILSLCGGFAFSAETPKQVEKLLHLCKAVNARPVIHHVMGSVPLSGTKEVLRAADRGRVAVTLLGYKTVGRGGTFKPHDYSGWIPMCRELVDANEIFKISIDTALAAGYEQELLEAEVPSWMFHVKEGSESMYLDAVKGEVGPSSFCDPSLYVPVPGWTEDDLRQAWAGITPQRAS